MRLAITLIVAMLLLPSVMAGTFTDQFNDGVIDTDRWLVKKSSATVVQEANGFHNQTVGPDTSDYAITYYTEALTTTTVFEVTVNVSHVDNGDSAISFWNETFENTTTSEVHDVGEVLLQWNTTHAWMRTNGNAFVGSKHVITGDTATLKLVNNLTTGNLTGYIDGTTIGETTRDGFSPFYAGMSAEPFTNAFSSQVILVDNATVSGDDVSTTISSGAVPEFSTWALIVAVLGVMGAFFYRKE